MDAAWECTGPSGRLMIAIYTPLRASPPAADYGMIDAASNKELRHLQSNILFYIQQTASVLASWQVSAKSQWTPRTPFLRQRSVGAEGLIFSYGASECGGEPICEQNGKVLHGDASADVTD